MVEFATKCYKCALHTYNSTPNVSNKETQELALTSMSTLFCKGTIWRDGSHIFWLFRSFFLCQAGSDILFDNCTYIQVHMGFKVTRSSSAGVCLQESNLSSGYLHGLPLCGRWWYTCLSEGDICCHPEKTQMLDKECLAWKCNNRADLIYNSCVCLLFHPVCWWHFSDNVSCGRADSLLWTPKWCREVWEHRLADNASSLCVSFHPEPQHTAQSRS